MAEATCPIVLVEIDRNSRIRILQHEGLQQLAEHRAIFRQCSGIQTKQARCQTGIA